MAAITFPLSVLNFTFGLKVASCDFWDPAQQEISGTRGGQILVADVGPQLWRGRVQLVPAYHDDAAAVEAMLSRLQGPDAAFYTFDPRRIGPRSDPTGSAVASSSPTIHTLAANNREMRVQGLPAGYVLSVGDMIAFDYTVNSKTLRALHRLLTGATADGTGLTPLFEVTPAIRPGAATTTAVQLIRPACKARMVPGSLRYGSGRPLITEGASFDFIQVLG